MKAKLLHIFANNPFGRETLLQSNYFCKKVGAALLIYIPKHRMYSMHFENDVVKFDLDNSYFTSSKITIKHAKKLFKKMGIRARFLDPNHYDPPMLPVIQPNFDFMTYHPRRSCFSSKIGLSDLDPGIGRVINSARFPILLSSPEYKEWQSIAVFWEGSVNGINALKLGFRISRASGIRIDVFPQMEKGSRESYEKAIKDKSLQKEISRRVNKWHIFEKGTFDELINEVPLDALVVLCAYSHNRLKAPVFGNRVEKIQSSLGNNLLIAGPNYKEPNTSLPSRLPFL